MKHTYLRFVVGCNEKKLYFQKALEFDLITTK